MVYFITNLLVLFGSPSSKCSSCVVRKHIIDDIHPIVWVVPMALTSHFYVLGSAKVSCIIVMLWLGFLVLENLDMRSARAFGSLDTDITSKNLNCFFKPFTF